MTGINGARGEVALRVNGEMRRLCLTLGALAEIETALDANGGGLAERLRGLGAAELMIVTAALLGGGGESVSVDELSHLQVDPVEAASAVAKAFEAAFSE